MTKIMDETRPDVDAAMSRQEFERWYWPVADLVTFSEHLGLSKSGRKAELRERVALRLGGEEVPALMFPQKIKADKFNWGKAELSRCTVISASISFGPNVRGFFKREIGKTFVCHSDFMDWVRENTGATLGDAIEAWHLLEARKEDSEFRREIATCNNYLQYLRDIRDAHPDMTLTEAKACWDHKKVRPATDGRVIYEPSDLRFSA